MNNKVLAVIVAIIVVGGGFYWWHQSAQAPTNAAQSYNWSFKDAGTDSQGNPQTEVSLNGRVVGTYTGSCSQIDGTSWTLLAGEQSGAICYFAGGGNEIGVFDGAVKVGDVSEGDAETPGSRANFQTVYSL